MATLGDLNVLIGADISRFEAAMSQAQQGIGKLGDYAKQAGQALTTYVTLPLAGLAAGAIVAAAKVDSLTRGLQAVTQQQLGEQGVTGLQGIAQAAADTQNRLKELREVAKLPGLGFTEAIQGDIRLRAVGLSADLSKRALLAFGNAIATTGGGKSELDRVTVQLGQLSAKGKVLAQDLRPIIEAAPAVATALKKLYGTVDSETISKSLEKQGKSSTDFINTLTDELAKLPKVTGGLAIAGENISDSLTLAGSKIGLTAEKLFDLSGIANRAGEFIEGLADKFAGLDPGTQKLIFGLGAAAAAAGPLIFGLGAIAAAVPSVVAGLEVLGLASTAALGPLGIGVAAVAAGAALIVANWDELVQYFEGSAGDVFGDLFSGVGAAVGAVADAFKALASGPLGQALAQLERLQLGFGLKVITVAVAGLASLLELLAGNIRVATDLLSLNFRKAAVDAAKTGEGVIRPFADLLGIVRQLPAGFDGAAEGGGRFGTSLLQASGILTGFNAQLQGFAGGLPNYGKSLAEFGGLLPRLEAQLKGLKEQQEAATTEAATLSFNPAIKSLEAYIARLRGASTSTKQAQKDIKALKEDLLGLRIADIVKPLYETPEFKLKGLLPEIGKDPLDVGPLLPNYESIFATAAATVVKGGGQVTDAFDKFGEKLSEKRLKQLDSQREFNTGFNELIEDLNKNVAPLVAGFAVQFGDALGSIVTGNAGVTDAIQSLFGGILASIGGFMTSFGEQLVILGIGKQALDSLFTAIGTGPLAIAAGLGLIALGSIASSVGKSAAAGARSVGSGGSSLGSQPSTNYGSSAYSNQQPLKLQFEFRLRGQDLVAVGRGQDYRELRTR